MESRKLKRYDSAPISTGVSSSTTAAAAAARANGHVSNIPRPGPGLPQPSPASAASAKPTINATTTASASAAASSSSPTRVVINPADPYEKQLEVYARCLEEDNQALMNHYEIHSMDIASLKVLAQERKFKDVVFTAMEAKAAAMEEFLQAVAELTAPQRGLRNRSDANAKESSGKSKPMAAAPVAPTMATVRDAVEKMVVTVQSLTISEEKHALTIRALEQEVAEWKEKARSRTARTKAGSANTDGTNVDAEDDLFFAGTSKELREAQRKVRDLERRLTSATADAKDATAAVAQMERQQQSTMQTLQRREEELAAMRTLLNSKEQLLAALEEEAHATRASASVTNARASHAVSPRPGSTRYSRTNSAPASQQQQQQQPQPHRCGGETSSDRLVVTHHYRLLGGQRFVDGQEFSAESFKDAFLRSLSTVLRVPYGYLTSVEVRTHAEAVSVELDIRHSARLKEDEIDFLLLSHDYPEVMTYLEKVQAELASKKPLDRSALRVKELQTLLSEKEQENAFLRRKLRAAEESVERRDAERATMDKDVDAALQETESTVKELYAALQAAQQETELTQKELSAKALQARVTEQAKDVVVAAAEAAERKNKEELAKLKEEVAQAHAEVAREKEKAAQAVRTAQAENKAELRIAPFTFEVALTTASSLRTAASLLKDAQQTRLVHALLLGYAGRVGGAIPVQVKKCVVSENPTTSSAANPTETRSPSVLQVTVELAYYAARCTHDDDGVKAEVQRKLMDGGSCPPVQEYIRQRTEATRRESAVAADAQRAISEAEQRATAAIAAMRAETQHTHETKLEAAASQLREINARVSSVMAPASSSSSAADVVSRVDQLIARLTSAEASSRHAEEESQRTARRLVVAQQEREQLQQTLSELTSRCAEVRLAKEQLAARLTSAEAALAAAQTSADESASAVAEKVRRLETALRTKTAAAEADQQAAAAELKTSTTVAAARLAEAQEALAQKDKELSRVQSKLEAATAKTSSSSLAGKGSVNEEAALREALRIAKEDRTALARQVKEMETDMNDLSNIQAAMQRELESAQQELRAKKHDFDLLVKQLIRMEEKEKKWHVDQQQQQQGDAQQQPTSSSQPASPHASARNLDDENEKDDVARESLVVLTNSNTNLQQCLRKLQRTMNTMGMDVNDGSSSSVSNQRSGSGATTAAGEDGAGGRRSGHRKCALAATVSRAAMEHQQLSAQLSEMLLPMLDELDATLSSSNNNNTTIGSATTNGRQTGSGSGAAFTRTASRQSNTSAAPPARIVKQHLSNSPFMRTRSTPVVVVERVSQDATNADSASHRSTPKKESQRTGAAFGSPTVTNSAGKSVVVDAAPRLDFHRQNSARTFVRSNTAAVTPATGGSGGGSSGAGLPPSSAVAATTSAGGDGEKERRSHESTLRKSSTGAGATSASGGATSSNLPRRNAPSSTTAKINPFRRSNTAAATGSSSSTSTTAAAAVPSNSVNFARVASGYRRTPTNVSEPAAAGNSSQVHKAYRMRF